VGVLPSQPDTVLMCAPWPQPRIAVFMLVHDLIAILNRLGRSVVVLCEGCGVRDHLGPNAICFLEFPADEPFDWEAGFCAKRLYPSLSAFLDEDRARAPSLLANVGVLHAHQDQLIFDSAHPHESKNFDRRLADYLTERTGRRPRLVRTRYEDLQGNLDSLMRMTGIDYVALGRGQREQILNEIIDFQPIVGEHVRRHKDWMARWGWSEAFQSEILHHVWWRLRQLVRWREEVRNYDAVVCLTRTEVDQTRDFLLAESARNLTSIPCGSAFAPQSQARMRRLLDGYRNHEGLTCWRGAEGEWETVSLPPEGQKVVFVGRSFWIKGVFELVESLRDLYHSGRKSLRGILVGDFPWGYREELAAIDPAHAHEYLLFPGWVEDPDVLAALFALGDVTALPSHSEAFALVGIESYRMGTPCVVTEGTGAGEAYLTEPRKHGFDIARPVRRRNKEGITRYYGVDVASLTAELAFLLDHPAEARRMGEDGERFVRQHYSIERMGARYNELYNLLLAGEPADRLSS
jgi:glycosyltransferase involved in cell wall biosynthesis